MVTPHEDVSQLQKAAGDDCPPCTGSTNCCDCACRHLCVVFVPDDSDVCFPIRAELAWNGDSFAGIIAGIDVLYYFDSNDTGCYFKLRSVILGHPEGYELSWRVGDGPDDVTCLSLLTSTLVPAEYGQPCAGGALNTSCAKKIVPDICQGCDCACECLCVTYQKGPCTQAWKACWDEYAQGWVLSGYPDTTDCDYPVDLIIYLRPDSDYGDRCALVLCIGGEEFESDPGCPDVSGSWTIHPYGDETITVTARCAVCEESCLPVRCCAESMPDVIYLTVRGTYVYGTIQLNVTTQGAKVVWFAAPGSQLMLWRCANHVETLEPVDVGTEGAVVSCFFNPYLIIQIQTADIRFSVYHAGCKGHTWFYDSPEVVEFFLGGNRCQGGHGDPVWDPTGGYVSLST